VLITSPKSLLLCTILVVTSAIANAEEPIDRGEPAPIELITPPVIPQKTLESADAQWFIAQVNRGLRAAYIAQFEAAWLNATDLTKDHELRLSKRSAEAMGYLSAVISLAARFDHVKTDEITARQLTLLKRATSLPAPQDDQKRIRLASLSAKLEGMYGAGKKCNPQGQCRDLEQLETVIRESDDPAVLKQAWLDWREVAVPMRPLYTELVTLANEGAQTLNFRDLGDLWRSQYDMPPSDFEAEMMRLWDQVKPLYESLHCHVRAKLNDKYGDELVPLDQAIPAHLVGNMWAQDWSQLYPLMIPAPKQPSLDVTAALIDKKYKPLSLTKLAESFFISLGFEPLPPTFWTRSLFTKPVNRDVVCHASAWDVHMNNDLRLKMCIKIDHEDLITLHHELGHHYYYQSYYTAPLLLQEGANDGFHEGIGDTLALSVTPSYLYKQGILGEASEHPDAVLNQQMRMGLEKLAFLPFGLLVDQWRWRVFSGDVNPEGYNQLWWTLREQIQGIRSPIKRPLDAFDPGAKYHIPGHTPYMRYFIAHILQFQFHRALCEEAGHKGPLHSCSIHGSKAAGAKLKAMLELGASKPWPEALKLMTGSSMMDATALIDYFQPLQDYLKQQNLGRQCGWKKMRDSSKDP
jgi:peptidyl-dipeptidase A